MIYANFRLAFFGTYVFVSFMQCCIGTFSVPALHHLHFFVFPFFSVFRLHSLLFELKFNIRYKSVNDATMDKYIHLFIMQVATKRLRDRLHIFLEVPEWKQIERSHRTPAEPCPERTNSKQGRVESRANPSCASSQPEAS